MRERLLDQTKKATIISMDPNSDLPRRAGQAHFANLVISSIRSANTFRSMDRRRLSSMNDEGDIS